MSTVTAALAPIPGGDVGTPIPFDASGSSASGGGASVPIASYTWDFGDGTTSTSGSPTTTHIYAYSDTYLASVVATAADGSSARSAVRVVVITGTPVREDRTIDNINVFTSAGVAQLATRNWAAKRANHSGTQLAATISDFAAAVSGVAIPSAQKGAPSGVAPLDAAGLVPVVNLPAATVGGGDVTTAMLDAETAERTAADTALGVRIDGLPAGGGGGGMVDPTTANGDLVVRSAVVGDFSVTASGDIGGVGSTPDVGLPAGLEPFSVECWFKNVRQASHQTPLVRWGSGKGANSLNIVRASDADISIANGFGAYFRTAGLPSQDDGWHYVAITYDGNTLRVYVDGNGVQAGAASIQSTLGGSYHLGGPDVNGELLTGLLDRVATYGTVLSGARVAAHFASRVDVVGYDAAVMADAPLHYHKLQEAAGDFADSGSLNSTLVAGPGLTYRTPGALFAGGLVRLPYAEDGLFLGGVAGLPAWVPNPAPKVLSPINLIVGADVQASSSYGGYPASSLVATGSGEWASADGSVGQWISFDIHTPHPVAYLRFSHGQNYSTDQWKLQCATTGYDGGADWEDVTTVNATGANDYIVSFASLGARQFWRLMTTVAANGVVADISHLELRTYLSSLIPDPTGHPENAVLTLVGGVPTWVP